MTKFNSIRMGTKGRIVLPPDAREVLRAEEGEDLILVVRPHEVVLMSRDAGRALVREAFSHTPNAVDDLIAGRRAEVQSYLAESASKDTKTA